MYSILHNILEDKEGGRIFTCFSVWHFFYIFLAIGLIAVLIHIFNNKEQSVKERVLRTVIAIPFGLYMADFFLMPLAYGQIDIDKLPFHACTALCVLCFMSNHDRILRKYRIHFALFGLLSNLMYLIYPAGVMAYEINALSYRVIQTLLFHSIMVVYCLLALVFDEEGLNIRKCYRDPIIIGGMSLWAMIGNTLYSGAAEGYSRDFNWFFVKADPFGIFSESIAPYIMPWLNVIVFFALEMLIYLVFAGINKVSRRAVAA